MGLGSGLLMWFEHNMSLQALAQSMVASITSWPLLAMPLFILAGNLMVAGGSAKRLMNCFNALFGHVRGGLLIATIGFCTVFAALSGSGFAAAAAVGPIMFKEMRKAGYSDGLMTSAVAVSSELGILIPPSVFFIILGMFWEVSTASIFAAGMVPGLILAALYAIVGTLLARSEKVKTVEFASWQTKGDAFIKALPAFSMPVIILGGIYTGFFTPTEAAAVACLCAIGAGLIYRSVTSRGMWDACLQAAKTNIVMYALLAGIGAFTYVIARSGVSQSLTELVYGLNLSRYMLVSIYCVMLIAMGFIFPPVAVILITAPLLLPTFTAMGISLLWMAVLLCVCANIGMMTPPMCVSVYFVSKIADVAPAVVIKRIWYFIVTMVVFLFVLIFVPEIALWFPRTLGMQMF